jgi:hypothetical protein
MAAAYYIDGVKFYRRSLVRLSAAERQALATAGQVILRRPVDWPLPYAVPDFTRTYPDPGYGLWGPGPYLKVPNPRAGEDYEPINRVFCPWGYPPVRLRVAHSRVYLRLADVTLVRTAPAAWDWLLTAAPWTPEDTATWKRRRQDQKPSRPSSTSSSKR